MLGITHDQVTKGPMALMYSDLRGFTDEERERFEANHWANFNQWLADVAARRGMSFEEAESLAHGRVWSGRQAVENGLVDELGGLDRAVEVAKELAGISADEAVTLVHYPQRRSLFEMLLEQDGDVASAAVRWMLVQLVREDLAQAARLVAGPSMMTDELRVR
jgi:protease-4